MINKKLVSIDESSLPNGWKALTLADVTEYIQRGKGPKYVEHSGLPVINQKCIRWFGIQKEHLRYVDPAQWNAWAAERYVRAGDILWNSTGTGTIGRAALIKNLTPEEKYVVDSHVTIVRPKDVEPQYIHYWIMSPAVQGSIEAMQSGSTNQVELSKSAVEALPIPVAPLDQQKRIVAEIEKQFSRLDEAVANLKRVKANLKRYKAAVLKSAVEGRLVETEAALARREGRSFEKGAQLLQRILDIRRSQWKGQGKYKEPTAPDTTDLPELPEGWVWASWEQVGFSQNGRPFPSKDYCEEGVRLLRPGNLHESGVLVWTAENTRHMPSQYAERNPDLIVEGGELVINLTAQSLRDEFLGRVCSTANDERCLLNQRLARLTPIEIVSEFALAVFKSKLFRRFVDGLNTGSLIQHMFTSQLAAFAFPIAPLAEQQRIAAELECRLSIIRVAEAVVDTNSKRAQTLRQSTLQRCFAMKE